MFPLVAIIVLNFNGRTCLLPCLQSLQGLSYSNFFVVVVDNASSDHSLEDAEAQFPEHAYLKNEKNMGFAGGMNIGMAEAFGRGAEWVWLFNNDALSTETALTELISVATSRLTLGLASPIVRDRDTLTPWFEKGRIDWLRMRALHSSPSQGERAQEAYPSDFLTGCALLVKKGLYEKIGGFDERFFLYYEDVDLSLRARQAGFEVLVISKAVVTHSEQSATSKQKLYYLVLSGLFFFQKHQSFWQKPYYAFYLIARRIKNSSDVWLGKPSALSVKQAYNNFLHGN